MINTIEKDHSKTAFVNPEFKKFRESEFSKFLELGLPTKSNEAWKYTNIEKYLPEHIKLDSNDSYTLPEFYKDKRTIVFVNGNLNSDLGTFKNIQALSHNTNTTTFLEQFDTSFSSEALLKLNIAYLDQGTSITIDGEEDEVLYLLHLGNTTNSNFTHHIINAKKHSKATICEVFIGDNNYVTNSATTILIEDGANLEHIIVQNESDQAVNTKTVRCRINKDASYDSTVVHLGSKLSRLNFNTIVQGTGSYVRSNGLYALNNEQHCDNFTLIEHDAAHTNSDQLYKGILDDKARGVFTGKIHIKKDSQIVESSQLNKNLLLSAKSQANSMPQLEIFADDVKCSHGSTTGQLSEDELFYFQARAITKQKARVLLANAFAFDVIYKIKNTQVRDYIANELSNKFLSFNSIKENE
jgi:Fe-S cluster assembly protein SufD